MISKNNNFQTFCRLTAQPTNGSTSLWRQRKKDWHTIEAAFYKRWLKKKTAKKMTEEFEVKIMEPHLKMEDLGKKEKVTGRDIYTHIAWANKMSVLIKGAKLEATTTYIGLVRRELQKLLREKIGIGHTDWMVFLQAVQDVDIDHIRKRWCGGMEERTGNAGTRGSTKKANSTVREAHDIAHRAIRAANDIL